MDNPTTNEQIALELGWRQGQANHMWHPPDGNTVWYPPPGTHEGEPLSVHPPDYERDWAHNGPLQDELWAAGFDLSHDTKDGTFYWYKINKYGPPLDDDREDITDLKKATALDWLAWKKEEKDEEMEKD